MMRRRLELFIPIVLFAVLVQLMAPIGAFRAVASIASDPLAMAATCAEMAVSTDGQSAPAHSEHQGNCCAFCAASHGAVAILDPPQPVFVTLQRQYQRVVWLEAVEPARPGRIGSNAQARAPPLFS